MIDIVDTCENEATKINLSFSKNIHFFISVMSNYNWYSFVTEIMLLDNN